MQTATAMSPPSGTNPNVGLAFPDDEIEQIGDEIANLTLVEAVNLTRYLDGLSSGTGVEFTKLDRDRVRLPHGLL